MAVFGSSLICLVWLIAIVSAMEMTRRPKHSFYDKKEFKIALKALVNDQVSGPFDDFLIHAQEQGWCLTRPLLQFLKTGMDGPQMQDYALRMIDAGANVNAKFSSGWILDPKTFEFKAFKKISRKRDFDGRIIILESLLSQIIPIHHHRIFAESQYLHEKPKKLMLDVLVERGAKRADLATIYVAITRCRNSDTSIWLCQDSTIGNLLMTGDKKHPLLMALLKASVIHADVFFLTYFKGLGCRLDFKFPNGENLLMFAYHGCTMHYLLMQPEMVALINQTGPKGTVLHYMTRYGHEAHTISELLNLGADPTIVNEDGNTAAMEALFNSNLNLGHTMLIMLLPRTPMVRNKAGDTLIDLLLETGKDGIDLTIAHVVRAWERRHALETFEKCIPLLSQLHDIYLPKEFLGLISQHINVFEDSPHPSGFNSDPEDLDSWSDADSDVPESGDPRSHSSSDDEDNYEETAQVQFFNFLQALNAGVVQFMPVVTHPDDDDVPTDMDGDGDQN